MIKQDTHCKIEVIMIGVSIHDNTWDRKKGRKEERQTPKAMKKWKRVASGGIWTTLATCMYMHIVDVYVAFLVL